MHRQDREHGAAFVRVKHGGHGTPMAQWPVEALDAVDPVT